MGIFTKVKEGLRNTKDVSAAHVFKAFLQQRFGRYGELKSLTLDSRAKQITAEVVFAGEPDSIFVYIRRYELTRSADGYYFTVKQASASKAWVNHALQDLAVDRRLPLLEKHAALLARAL